MFKVLNLLAFTSIAIIALSNGPAPANALSLGDSHHHARSHEGLAKRKNRDGPKKVCKPRPTTTPAHTTTTHATTTNAPPTTKAAPTTTSKAPVNTPHPKGPVGNAAPTNGRKAGLAGGNAFQYMQDQLGWWYDWSPTPSGHSGGGTVAPAMLWGAGHQGGDDSSRLQEFKSQVAYSDNTPRYVLGFNEPDCHGSASSNIDPQQAAGLWKQLIAPVGDRGALLGSPAMCMQDSENWLKPFEAALDGSRSWDFTAVHIYQNNMDGVRKVLDHYASYGRPMWITEFGCVNPGFTPCEDQGQINDFIYGIVDVFENDSRVHAYGYTDGGGLGTKWLPTNGGQYGTGLSQSGQAYKNAISKYA